MTTYFPSPPTIVDSNRILYTASPFAKSSLLHLHEIGSLHALKPHVTEYDALLSYLFFIVKEGEGTVVYEGKEYYLTAGSCVFVDCKRRFSHSVSENNLWTLQWCHFYGPTMPMIYEKYMERGGLNVFNPKDITAFSAILDSIFSIAGSNDYIRDMKINTGLSDLLSLLMAESWHRKESNRSQRSKQSVFPIKEHLEQNYNSKVSLDELASKFYLSKNYMNRIFKEQFGMPIKEYLQVIRITNAKRLLRTTNWTIEQVGTACGFESIAYFSRAFKAVEGIAPSQYREKR